jgi:hypothetical protein
VRCYGLAYCNGIACGERLYLPEKNASTDQFGLKGTYDFPLNVTSDIMSQGRNTDLPSFMAVGSSFRPTVKLKYQEPYNGKMREFTLQGTWTPSDSSILSVSSDGTIVAKSDGTAMLTFASDGMTWSYSVDAGRVTSKAMYRLYNRWSGEHLFTMDREEVSNLVSLGLKDEGVA